MQHHCLKPVSFYPATTPLGRLKVGIEWLLFKRGIGATNVWEAGSFFKTRPDVAFPNLQHHFTPVAISYDGEEKIEGHGFQIHISQMRPRSRALWGFRPTTSDAPSSARHSRCTTMRVVSA